MTANPQATTERGSDVLHLWCGVAAHSRSSKHISSFNILCFPDRTWANKFISPNKITECCRWHDTKDSRCFLVLNKSLLLNRFKISKNGFKLPPHLSTGSQLASNTDKNQVVICDWQFSLWMLKHCYLVGCYGWPMWVAMGDWIRGLGDAYGSHHYLIVTLLVGVVSSYRY